MAKHYGILVGALIAAARPTPTSNVYENGVESLIVRDQLELAAAQNDTVQAAVVPWETVLNPDASKVYFDDLGTGCTLSLGDATYPNALINAQDVASAAGSCAAMKSVDISNAFKPLWAVLGYATLAAAKAVGPHCELLFKVNGAAAAGTLAWQFFGSKR